MFVRMEAERCRCVPYRRLLRGPRRKLEVHGAFASGSVVAV